MEITMVINKPLGVCLPPRPTAVVQPVTVHSGDIMERHESKKEVRSWVRSGGMRDEMIQFPS